MQDLLLSGIKPTSIPHIGNYIGALKQWKDLQHTYPCLFMIADLHAITVPQDPKQLRAWTRDAAASYLASGLDPSRSSIFIQSHVPAHAQLGWILSTIAKMGEMERMTQFKDKSQKGGREDASVGLFTYPALMAADILLYDTTVVPVGDDQMQHIEIARDLAQRFNHQFGETFVLPKGLIQTAGARIMSLQTPNKKMSKSDASNLATIWLNDDADTIRKKIMKAVTDTEPGVVFDKEKKPAVANLMTIYHHMTGQTMHQIEAAFENKGYGDFKKALAEAVVDHLAPITTKLKQYQADPAELDRILAAGRDKANTVAEAKLKTVFSRVGLM